MSFNAKITTQHHDDMAINAGRRFRPASGDRDPPRAWVCCDFQALHFFLTRVGNCHCNRAATDGALIIMSYVLHKGYGIPLSDGPGVINDVHSAQR
ncbi:hypothetical protein BX600DRAFT_151418 [Xylariales sp. PMI_506]|nr:hypothetical protein BX600DRAFT_151418 [Xylariales sp. PMI_506]